MPNRMPMVSAMWLGVKREDLIKPVRKKDDGQPELP